MYIPDIYKQFVAQLSGEFLQLLKQFFIALQLGKLCTFNNKLNLIFSHRERVITKTCQNNIDPFKPHFYKVKLGFTGV